MSTCFNRAEFPCLAVSLGILYLYLRFGSANIILVNCKNLHYVARAIDDVVRTVV